MASAAYRGKPRVNWKFGREPGSQSRDRMPRQILGRVRLRLGAFMDESFHKMSKPYSQMTPAERLADRIAKNREIDRRVQEAKAAASAPAEVRHRRKAAADALEEFQRIKRERGIDAASDYVHEKSKAQE